MTSEEFDRNAELAIQRIKGELYPDTTEVAPTPAMLRYGTLYVYGGELKAEGAHRKDSLPYSHAIVFRLSGWREYDRDWVPYPAQPVTISQPGVYAIAEVRLVRMRKILAVTEYDLETAGGSLQIW